MFRNRYSIILLYGIISIISFAFLRAVLCVRSWNVIDHSFFHLLYIFSVGFVYDVTVYLYVALFFSLVLLIIPDKIYNSAIYKIISSIFFFLFLYLLYFDLTTEWFFWDEFKTRFNFIAVDYLIYTQEVIENIYQSYHFNWVMAAIFVLSLLTFYIFRGALNKNYSSRSTFSKRAIITLQIIIFCLFSYYVVGQSLRESFYNNYEKELSSNGPFQFVEAFRSNDLDYKDFYALGNDAELSKLVKESVGKNPQEGGLYDISRNIDENEEEMKLNVILISVESLNATYLTHFGNEEEDITPFMDKWVKEGIIFNDFYATGTRTTRGLESIALSIPPTPGRSLVKRPDNGQLQNIGKVFKDHGYDVAFLYGGRGYFDNMNVFFSGNGYRIVDQNTLTSDEITFENAWGVADGDLYQKTIKEANSDYEKGRNFFFHIMTTSNHRPYTYPDGKIDIKPGTGRSGAVKYTDYALGELISSAKKCRWFDDTIFVVVADHCAGSSGKIGLPLKRYHIPLFIYAPKYIAPKEVEKISSQIDIAPTVLSLLHFKYKSFFWGRDILNDGFIERALISNYEKLGLFQNGKLIILSPHRRIDLVESPENPSSIVSWVLDDPLTLEAISYYQGADYILKNRMNRWI